MGADMIGYLVKGPASISDELWAEAERKLVLEMTRFWGTMEIQCPECDTVIDVKEMQESQEDVCPECGCGIDAAVKLKLTDAEAVHAFVTEARTSWPPVARDTVVRGDPDDPDKILAFAGGMSWGDDPEGEGYLQLKRLLASGLGKYLGIR